MSIPDFAHKGLKRIYVEATTRGGPPDTVEKLRKMFAYLDNFEDPEELRALTAWKAHTFTGVWRTTVSPQERKRTPVKNPLHPGEFIRAEIIEPAGLSVTAAPALRVSRPALCSLFNGRADLSGGMALRIEKAFGVKA